ncbi:hypothetical protein [Undibacterium terreum]|uniref:Uncharacterized protein n=1 Tax=Undibacterium terreum TaxID=1224302 RepID=A0A916U8E0_9BURK|nr:hypothetical protein [Undibacterium terreum]GGC62404.1 hypothetical protein GCM10011396_06630 [Undibacterium terreum]
MSTRTKRWNGKIDTFTPDYLKNVVEKMTDYGDRVQFALTGTGIGPNYQTINAADKRMTFDSSNRLVHPKEDEFSVGNVSGIFTLDQIKMVIAGGVVKTSSGTRVTRSSSGATRNTTAAVKAQDLIDAAKYDYFKNNRQTLPPTIGEHSAEITGLMKKGMSAEDAFADVVKRYF